MYQHILFPTDGSERSQIALKHALGLAKAVGAKITALHVVPEYYPPVYEDSGPFDPEIEARFEREAVSRAERFLSQVTEAASAAGVTSAAVHVTSYHTADTIIKVAQEQGCDLIIMSSGGRKGLASLLLGSETKKVLAHTKTPVLICK
ncbi:MAG: universal stress protein [Proteobacteria bacterium]|nr:universal stress protein [Burkholderiales bacterium]